MKSGNRLLNLRLLILVSLLPGLVRAQAEGDSAPPAKGIGASAGIAVKVGAAELQRAGGSQLLGVDLDLGRFGSATRFQLEATLLRGDLNEFVLLEDQTYDGSIYDLTGALAAVQLLRSPTRRVQPFISAGLSVHAMSSSFNSTILDRRYNTNNFGAHAGFGVRVRLGRSGHRALAIEVRRTTVRDMNRVSLTVGMFRLMRELAVPLGG